MTIPSLDKLSIRILRRLLVRSSGHERAFRMLLDWAIRTEERIQRKTMAGVDAFQIVSAPELIAKLSNARRDRTVCHVLGSGSSVVDTVKDIDEDDSVFTCNFGGLAFERIDLYLLELASSSRRDMSDAQARIIAQTRGEETLVLFKNIWEGKIDPAYAADNYPEPRYLLRDILLPVRGNEAVIENPDAVFGAMFEPAEYLRQYVTTVFTLVQLAALAGYRRIVVHGLDGKGAHYFHRPEQPGDLAIHLRTLMPAPREGTAHAPGANALDVFAAMRDYLAKSGIELVRAAQP